MTTHSPQHEAAIREQAYYFWEQDGRPDGREAEHWMRAVVAVTEKDQMDTLVQPDPESEPKAKAKAPKAKAAASKARPAPVKTAKPATVAKAKKK